MSKSAPASFVGITIRWRMLVAATGVGLINVYVWSSSPGTRGDSMRNGDAASCAGSSWRFSSSSDLVATRSALPADTRRRTSIAWSWSRSSRPSWRSTLSTARAVVVLPTKCPSRIARSRTPGPASNPPVSANSPWATVGPSNRHSVRRGGSVGAGLPETTSDRKRSTRRVATGSGAAPHAVLRTQPRTVNRRSGHRCA